MNSRRIPENVLALGVCGGRGSDFFGGLLIRLEKKKKMEVPTESAGKGGGYVFFLFFLFLSIIT